MTTDTALSCGLAIVTKFHGPTNHKPGRVSARAEGHKAVFVSWDHSLSSYENHLRAAGAFCERAADEYRKRLGQPHADTPWTTGDLLGAGLPDSTGYAFICVH